MEQILKASYGDRGQRDVNAKGPDRVVAEAIQADFKARKAAQHQAPVSAASVVNATDCTSKTRG